MAAITMQQGYYCPDCGTGYLDSSELIPLYECSTCGCTSAERRCESCNKFMGRAEEMGCPSCETAVEERDDLVTDLDGSVILAEDYAEDAPYSERQAQKHEAIRQQAAVRKAAYVRSILGQGTETTCANITPGQRLVGFRPNGEPDIVEYYEQPLVLNVMRPGPQADTLAGRVIVVYKRGSTVSTYFFSPDDPIITLPSEPLPPYVSGGTEDRFFGSPYRQVSVMLSGVGAEVIASYGGAASTVITELASPVQIRQLADALQEVVGQGDTTEAPLAKDARNWGFAGALGAPSIAVGLAEPLDDEPDQGQVVCLQAGSGVYALQSPEMARGLVATLRAAADLIDSRLDIH